MNQTLPSAPVVIPVGPRSAVKPGVLPATNRVTTPAVVMRPMAPGLTGLGEPQRAVRPAVICAGWLPGTANSVTTPAVVMRPIRPLASVNHRLPSGPAVIPTGWRSTENGAGGAIGNSVTTPSGVIRPIRPGPRTR